VGILLLLLLATRRRFHLGCLAIALTVILVTCAGRRPDAAANAAACNVLEKSMTDQEQAFVIRAQSIRSEHVAIQDYDRQMIAAIIDRRAALQATKLTELSVTEEVGGCSGKQLDDLRDRAQQELANLRDYLNDFNRALKTDPAGVFIDAP
jgi:hypothetical protein